MHTDSRGHTISTSSEDAAVACNLAIEKFCARSTDTAATLKQSIEADNTCVLSQAMMGLMSCSLRKNATLPMAKHAYDIARKHQASATRREQLYVDALHMALQRKPDKLFACLEAIIIENPKDILALTMAQGEAFWTGNMIRSEKLSRSTLSSWNASVPGYGDWLAIRAFDLEETGDLANAESNGRQAIELDQGNVWAAHAVAHVLEMRGESEAGVNWLDSLKDHWTDANQMKFHLWWHRCLCHVERGEYEEVLEIYDAWVRNPSNPLMQALPDFYLDIQNAASILMRLELVGIPVGHRWHELAVAIESAYLDITSPFTSAHCAITFAATGDFEKLDKMLDEIESFVTTEGALSDAYKTCIPVVKGIKAHRQNNHTQALELLMPMRSSLRELGGSHAQRDILFQIMFDSARQLKQGNLVNTLHQDLERIGFIDPQNRAGYLHG
ncbi:MAG: tetratricopeptide repeat protein [Granulosicoccus sp.]